MEDLIFGEVTKAAGASNRDNCPRLPEPAAGADAGGAAQRRDLRDQGAELQFGQEVHHDRRIEIMGACPFQVQLDRDIGVDGRQVAAHIGGVASLLQFRPPAVLHLVEMGIDLIQVPVFFQQPERGLLAHAGHAGDVVGVVPDHGFVIHHLLRADAELAGFHILRGQVGLVVARHVDRRALVHQLQEIAVAGDDLDAQSLRTDLARDGAEHIIRFEAFHFQARDVEGIHHLADARDLQAQVIGHFFARRLVVGDRSCPGRSCPCRTPPRCIRVFPVQGCG